ncbi:ester cyclase [Halobellus ruber]|uniref:Ester cyclase n=1 Tax=Halobellus ruber TaxID=2761102 RepID=A0A7J9SJI7_9EURY|nr:ester cyclase [Halobellus ruber]MBB6646702.1 ester cyclase [Halobellus ruber]
MNADVDPHIEAALEALNRQDTDGLVAEFVDGGTFTDPFVTEGVSGAELRAYFSDLFEAAPDLHLDVDRVVSPADGPTAIEGAYVGTHRGTLDGIPPTGNSVVVPTMVVIDVSPDGITAWRDYWDSRTFFEQLGLTFPEVVPLLPGLAVRKLKEFV